MRRRFFLLLFAISISTLSFVSIAFLSRSGSAPAAVGGATDECPAGDLNGDDSATVADVLYLLNYLFLEGPEPIPCAAQTPSAPGWPPAPDAIVNLCGEESLDYEAGASHTLYTVPEDMIFVVTQCLAEGRVANCAGVSPYFFADLGVNGSRLRIGGEAFVLGAGEDLKLTLQSVYTCGSAADLSLRWFVQGYLADSATGSYPTGVLIPNPTDLVSFQGSGEWDTAGDSTVVYTVPEGKRLVLTGFELPLTVYSEMQLLEVSADDVERLRFVQCYASAREPRTGLYYTPNHFNWSGGEELPIFFESGSEIVLRRAVLTYAYYPSAGEYLGNGFLIDAE